MPHIENRLAGNIRNPLEARRDARPGDAPGKGFPVDGEAFFERQHSGNGARRIAVLVFAREPRPRKLERSLCAGKTE